MNGMEIVPFAPLLTYFAKMPPPLVWLQGQPTCFLWIHLFGLFSLPSFIYLVLSSSFPHLFLFFTHMRDQLFCLSLTDFNQNILRFKSKVMEEICHGICPIFVIIIWLYFIPFLSLLFISNHLHENFITAEILSKHLIHSSENVDIILLVTILELYPSP